MPKRDPRLVSLGYGKLARADRIYALVPLDPKDRGEGRRTYVHVDGAQRGARATWSVASARIRSRPALLPWARNRRSASTNDNRVSLSTFR